MMLCELFKYSGYTPKTSLYKCSPTPYFVDKVCRDFSTMENSQGNYLTPRVHRTCTRHMNKIESYDDSLDNVFGSLVESP